jgi:hypothetical protein
MDWLAGHVGLELRNVGENYPFERAHRFAVIKPNSGRRDYSRSSCDGGRCSSGVVPGSHQRSGSPSLALSPKCQELTSRAVADSTSCFSLKVVSCRRRAPTHAGIFFSAAGWLMMGRIKSSARRRRPFRKISDTSLPSHITTMVKPNIRDSTTTPELGSQ